MKISFNVLIRPEALQALERHPALAATLDTSAIVVPLDADDPRLHQLLEITRDTKGLWLNPGMTFTTAEVAQARFLQLDCRSKIVNETAADSSYNRAAVDGADFHSTGGRVLPIKLVDRLALTKIAIAPNAIGCATHWTPEFVVPRGVADAFREEGLTGFELRPVFNSKTKQPHPDFFLLYSASIMPDAERDATTIDQRGTDNPGWRELGALTYDFTGSDTCCDFNRTAENWSNSHLPLWIVSQRVREAMVRRGLKGWGYRPVLEKGTPLHETYTRMWRDILDRVSVNPRNIF